MTDLFSTYSLSLATPILGEDRTALIFLWSTDIHVVQLVAEPKFHIFLPNLIYGLFAAKHEQNRTITEQEP